MGKAETYIVVAKVAILVGFAVIGLFFVKGARLSPADWKPPIDILFATAIAFIGFVIATIAFFVWVAYLVRW